MRNHKRTWHGHRQPTQVEHPSAGNRVGRNQRLVTDSFNRALCKLRQPAGHNDPTPGEHPDRGRSIMTPELQRLAGAAWVFRAHVEHDAAFRFVRLANALAGFDPESPAIALFRRASEDEHRHAKLCTELSAAYGRRGDDIPGAPSEIAPAELGPREALLYEVVAACCITETESVATLTTLLAERAASRVRSVLHEIAKDEVVHGQMGWAHLAREAARSDVSFLAGYLPVMLAGTVDADLFEEVTQEVRSDDLLRHGVLPRSCKREVFSRTLRDVVFPGLERFGIDASHARAWLEEAGRRGVASAHASDALPRRPPPGPGVSWGGN